MIHGLGLTGGRFHITIFDGLEAWNKAGALRAYPGLARMVGNLPNRHQAEYCMTAVDE